jgi:phosphoribosylformylglycinamidine cyclo-ligase
VPEVFTEIAERGSVATAEMYEVFNMGCGFCCVVPPEQAGEALSILSRRHAGAALIGRATTAAGIVELPDAEITGNRDGFHAA